MNQKPYQKTLKLTVEYMRGKFSTKNLFHKFFPLTCRLNFSPAKPSKTNFRFSLRMVAQTQILQLPKAAVLHIRFVPSGAKLACLCLQIQTRKFHQKKVS